MKKFMKNQLKVFQQIEKRLVTVMDMRKVQKLVLIEATKDQLKNQHTQHIIMLKNNFQEYLQRRNARNILNNKSYIFVLIVNVSVFVLSVSFMVFIKFN